MTDEPLSADPVPETRFSRRGLLFGGTAGLGLGLLAGAGAGFSAGSRASAAPAVEATPTAGDDLVPSRGATQAGIARPRTPQRHALVVVADLAGETDASRVLAAVAAVGDVVDTCTDPTRADPLLLPDGVGDLSVTIGIGPRLVRAVDPALPGAAGLPRFARDTALAAELDGGDLLVAVYASDAAVLHGVAEAVLAAAPGASRRWSQQGFRGAGSGMVARNPLGYHDGVIVPHSDEEFAENVWIPTGPAAGGTIAVVRRLRLDVSAFHAQPVNAQDRVIGRTRTSGAPLSGGGATDEVNLSVKSAEGEYVIPARAHVRAAHPSFTGSALMLRRGYAFSNATPPAAPPDDGLLFMCFQNDIEVFARTQHRLDETDDLMDYVTTTASASFLVLPGRAGDGPLGAGLR